MDLYKGFSQSLQTAATEFQKLREPKVTKLKRGYSSNMPGCVSVMAKRHPGQHIGMLPVQLGSHPAGKRSHLEQAWLKVEYYLGLTPKSEQSF